MKQEKNSGIKTPVKSLGIILFAIVLGVAITFVGVNVWPLLGGINLQYFPGFPWAALVMAGFLWGYWKYLSGSWWPKSTSATRKDLFRANPLNKKQWAWATIGMACLIFLIPAAFNSSVRIIGGWPEGAGGLSSQLQGMSTLMLVTVVFMVSLTAGVVEEIGFRGYMQRMIEKRAGVVLAILIQAVIFWAVHLNHPTGMPRIFMLTGTAVLAGYFAYATGSIIPGVIAHTLSDFFSGMVGTNTVVGIQFFNPTPISETGFDTHYVISFAVMLLCILGIVLSGRKVLALHPK